jgi:predicted small metal-binding protein
MRCAQDRRMVMLSAHRVQVAVDCECGTTVEACNDDELLDELLEHIAAAHETSMAREPAALLTHSYEA